MSKFCGQVNIPTVNNDAIACTNYFDTDCIIYQNPIAYFGTLEPSTSTQVFDFIISSLIDARTRLTTVEGEVLPTTHADLLGLAADDHLQYHTDGRALTWLGTRSTTDLPEGTNEYFTQARVLSSVLTGFNPALTGDVVGTDTVLEGFGKLQYQIDNFSSLSVVDSLSSTSTIDALSANQGNEIYNNSLFLEAMLSDVNAFGASGMANDNSDVATIAPQEITIVKRLDSTYRLVWDNTDQGYFDPSLYVLQAFNSDLGIVYNNFNAYLEDITLEQTIGTQEIYTFTTTGVSFIDNITQGVYGITVRLRATRFVGTAGGGQVDSVVAGTNITVDATDPANPIVSTVGVVDTSTNQTAIAGEKTFTGAFTKITNRLAVGSEPFGGTRLGDAAFQTPEIDTQTLNFKAASQLTSVGMFATPVGGSDGYVFSFKNFVDDVIVYNIAGLGAATYGGVGREMETTIGLRNDFVGGEFTVLDMFNQDYDAATEVANSTGWVAIHGGGATAKELGLWRYDTTTYTPIWELSPTDVWTFGVDVNVPDEVYGVGWDGSAEVPTKNAIYDKIENLVTLNTFQTITGAKIFDVETTHFGGIAVGDGVDTLPTNNRVSFTNTANPAALQSASFAGIGMTNDDIYWHQAGANSEWFTKLATSNTAARTHTLPDKSGTVAHLDDVPAISEGTFTPLVESGGGAITYTGTFTGTYYKTGKLVYFTISLSSLNSSGTGGGTFNINGLPFQASTFGTATVGVFAGLNTQTFYSVTSDINTGTGSQVRFNIQTALDGSYSQLTNAEFTGAAITVSGSYIATV